MKKFRALIAVILALILTVLPMMQASAAGQAQYISEIRIGYGEDGKAALKKEGFTVWQNLNANESGNGYAVWLGYKTTTDVNDAITDVALMNMKGGYSFDAYSQEIEDLNNRVSAQLASFKAAITEFRTNYAQGNAFAQQAYAAMNVFFDDDSTDGNGQPMGLSDLFIDENTSDETLHRIFLEGNVEAVAAIETALALACVETGDDNVLTRIAESEYPDTLDPQKNDARSALRSVFGRLHSEALSLQEVIARIDNFEGGADGFFAQETLSDEEICAYAYQVSKYELLNATEFGNTGMSFFDFAMLDEETENENGEVLEDEYLEMLAQSMTEGQLGIVANVGIMSILMNAAAGENPDEAVKAMSEAAAETAQPVSVYTGVDRQLFENIDGIALTSAALREKAAAENNDFGKTEKLDALQKGALTVAASMIIAMSSALTFFSMKGILAVYAERANIFAMHNYLYGSQMASELTTSAVSAYAGGVILASIGVIAIIVAVLLIIFTFLDWIEKPVEPGNIEYTQIPRVLVEKTEEGKFIPYYAAKLAGASENETDSTALYGDMNAINTVDEWVALYYSKSQSLGAPLTPDMLKKSDSTLSASEAENYSAIHMFGSTAAANLNQYNTARNIKAIYVFFRHDDSAVSQSGSIFTQSSVILSIATFVAGAGIAAAVTYLILRKKKEQPAAPAEA